MLLDAMMRAATRSAEDPSFSLTGATLEQWTGNSGVNASGQIVNSKTVFGLPEFKRAVELVSTATAKLPLQAFRVSPDGGKTLAVNHPATRLLDGMANEVTTSYHFRQGMTANALTVGNGYAAILRDNAGRAAELFQLDPVTTMPVLERRAVGNRVRTIRVDYAAYVGGTVLRIPSQDMLHVRGFSFDGLVGMSVVDVLRDPLGASMGRQKYAAVYYKNNARPNIVIELPGWLKDEEAIERFRASWGSVHKGVDNSHRPALLEGGAKLSTFNVSAEDAQLIESGRFGLVQVANIIGVPPQKLGAEINSSYNSLEQQNRDFLNDGLGGHLCSWKYEAQAKLLTTEQRRTRSVVIEHDRDELEQPDRKTQAEADVLDVNNGIRSVNEVRAKRNLAPVDGGDDYRIPLNHTTIGAEEEPAPMPEEPTPEPEPQRDERLKSLLEYNVTRFVSRVTKYVERASKEPRQFLDALDQLHAKHRSVLVADLTHVTTSADRIADELLSEIHEQLLEACGRVVGSDLPNATRQLMRGIEVDAPVAVAEKALEV